MAGTNVPDFLQNRKILIEKLKAKANDMDKTGLNINLMESVGNVTSFAGAVLTLSFPFGAASMFLGGQIIKSTAKIIRSVTEGNDNKEIEKLLAQEKATVLMIKKSRSLLGQLIQELGKELKKEGQLENNPKEDLETVASIISQLPPRVVSSVLYVKLALPEQNTSLFLSSLSPQSLLIMVFIASTLAETAETIIKMIWDPHASSKELREIIGRLEKEYEILEEIKNK